MDEKCKDRYVIYDTIDNTVEKVKEIDNHENLLQMLDAQPVFENKFKSKTSKRRCKRGDSNCKREDGQDDEEIKFEDASSTIIWCGAIWVPLSLCNNNNNNLNRLLIFGFYQVRLKWS